MNNDKYRNILGIISISRFFILSFIIIITTSKLSTTVNHTMLFISILSIITIYLWLLFYVHLFKRVNIKTAQIIEDYIFIVTLCILILFTNTYDSQYKYLYLFSIISSTISLGRGYGLTIASLSSASLLLIDLIFVPKLNMSTYLKNDLMLSSVFVLIAWILGEYKRVENDQKELLELRLREQLKQYSYIEEMMIKNEDCSNLLIKNSHYAIIVHSSDKILFLNEKALKFIEIDTLLKPNVSILSIYNEGYKKEIELKYKNIFNNKLTNISFEECVINKDGTNSDILNISTYCVYGKEPAILTIMRDITAEKQIQELKEEIEKNKKLLTETIEQRNFITEFFINMSHELKTPLNVIYSSIQVLNMYDDENFLKKRKQYLSIMKQNSYRLIRIVNNLLDITKCDTGNINLNVKNDDIIRVIEDLSISIVPYAERKGIELIFDTDVEEKIIAFDEDKIEKIILNLISNALKFTNKGGSIYVNILDGEETVKVSIKDTGIGIPYDKKESIFERFIQVDKTLKRKAEGTGIGLSLVKSFIELHKGNIDVKSEVGQGSEFIITLPVTRLNETKSETQIKHNITEKINMELSDIYMDVNSDIY